jgi:hypothetical protein
MMRSGGPELRLFAVNGRDELKIVGSLDESNLIAACERIDERLKTRGRSFQEVLLDVSDKGLEAVGLGRLIQCFSENHVRVKWIDASQNKLDDFDMHFAIGRYIESVEGRFLVDLDLSNNSIGDFGCITLLQAMIRAKLASTDRRITVVSLRENLIAHPLRVLEAIPADLAPVVFAPGVSQSVMSPQTLIQLVGLDSQRCARARSDFPAIPAVPVTRPLRSAREPEDDNW